jgi:sulfatase maturation enzyme AslB (radical SAM superfamily)
MTEPPRAACAGVDTDLFFAPDRDRRKTGRRRAVGLAAQYCRNCQIRRACHEDAEAHRDIGLRGGYWRYNDGSKNKATPLLDYLRDDDRTAA